RKPKDGQTLACATAELVRGAVAETLKYSTKPADMVADPEWFLTRPKPKRPSTLKTKHNRPPGRLSYGGKHV
ncbi:protein rep, partial [Salmonella enterica subsp. enterica serovar Kentucky]|nr:protein rep [Salmonella enterica subsp. enterica serovar Kentucky]